jgi:hypothetical protein
VRRPDTTKIDSFSNIFARERKVVALYCVDRLKDYVEGRKLVEKGVVMAPEDFADPSVALRDLLHEGVNQHFSLSSMRSTHRFGDIASATKSR